MLFLTLSNTKLNFLKQELNWRLCITVEALLTTKQIELIEKKKFAAIVFNLNDETFVVYWAFFANFDIYLFHKAQIVFGILDKASIVVLAKYNDFTDVFFPNLVAKLLKHTKTNNHSIKLVKNQQLPYGLIYSQKPVKLETLKMYIEINLASNFIRFSNFPTDTSIFYVQKPNRGLKLYIDYQDFNNLKIKNKYTLPLIGIFLDWLGWAKRFTQFYFPNRYHQMQICKGY